MLKRSAGLLACLLTVVFSLAAADVKGRVVDPAGGGVGGAQIAVTNLTGIVARTVSGSNGAFRLDIPDSADLALVVTAPGFATRTVQPNEAATVQLELAPRVDSVEVVGSTIELPAAAQASSVDSIPSEQVRGRNEPFAMDLLRYTPGAAFNQSGTTGGVASLFLRGGNSNMTLVQIDGVPVNSFGGAFDFAHLPSEAVERIDVVRGAQSAVYGSYANTGAIDITTRRPGSAPQLDLLAEGGSFRERRFAVTGSGTLAGFGILASGSRFDTDGLVPNGDYRNENLMLSVSRAFGRQRLSLHGLFDSNEVGQPGPWGSDPKDTYSALNLISRGKNNFSEYGAHYEIDITPRLREEVNGSFFLYNSGFVSSFGHSFNQDLRGQGEARTVFRISPHDIASAGVTLGRERVKNSFITDEGFSSFPLERNEVAVYAENRYDIGGLFISTGVRAEFFRTPAIPGDGFSRPFFPASDISRVNPKVAAGYVVGETRLHSSFGIGVRPPSGFELAFTNNPSLKPERTRSVDAGIEQKLFSGKLLLDGTYFYNRYYDLIVTLGGSLTSLSHYKSANLANSQAQGAEFSAKLRPARWMFVSGSYTLLETRILSLDGSNQAPLPFAVGQPLTRRPEHSGSFVTTFTRGRIAADLTGNFRGSALFEEPSFGASNGLFWNSGYSNIGVNLNIAMGRGVTVYGNLRNALNQKYEEIFGYPSLPLNFVTGLKWSIGRR
jgi:outer membrane cobalamin receptor